MGLLILFMLAIFCIIVWYIINVNRAEKRILRYFIEKKRNRRITPIYCPPDVAAEIAYFEEHFPDRLQSLCDRAARESN